MESVQFGPRQKSSYGRHVPLSDTTGVPIVFVSPVLFCLDSAYGKVPLIITTSGDYSSQDKRIFAESLDSFQRQIITKAKEAEWVESPNKMVKFITVPDEDNFPLLTAKLNDKTEYLVEGKPTSKFLVTKGTKAQVYLSPYLWINDTETAYGCTMLVRKIDKCATHETENNKKRSR